MRSRARFGFAPAGAIAAGVLVLALGAEAVPAGAATFGRVTPIGGQPADLALDEARGVLYVANFTANRVDVISTSDGTIRRSIPVAAQPASLALSRDGRFLVVGHFGNYAAPAAPRNALSVINLATNARQTFALGEAPFGVAFGADGLALVVTSGEFVQFDPASGATRVIDTIAGVAAKTLPVELPNFPPQIVAASMAVSGDGWWIYGLTDTLRFRYDVLSQSLAVVGYTSSPPQGPRTVSVSQDGSYFLSGWGLFDRAGRLLSQFAAPTGELNVGSHVIDSVAGVVYAQIPSAEETGAGASPVLMVADSDNLTVRERLRLPENLAGKALLNSARDVMYAVSDSGVMMLPVGSLPQTPRLAATAQTVIFRDSFCDRQPAAQQITIFDPSGGATDFELAPSLAGITVTPSSGVTPAVVQISVDPGAFQDQNGTVAAAIGMRSRAAPVLPRDIRVLINVREPDQRGDFVALEGRAVDLLADPVRDRFYVLVRERNRVEVFQGADLQRLATLRTANTPTQMTITVDARYLLVGHDNSQFVYVYDLESLTPLLPVEMPPGHYPRSVAASGNAILAASRVSGPAHTIDRIHLAARSAAPLPSLGIFENSIHLNTVLSASPNGGSILAAMADGTVLLYNSSADTFVAARKDFGALGGAYAASNYGLYLVDNNLLDSSLVPVAALEHATGSSSGFAFVDQSGLRTTTPSLTAAGVIQRVDLAAAAGVRPTRMAEAPLLGDAGTPFTRTLAPLASRTAIVALTVSGFTKLPWDYDAATVPPLLAAAVNAADGSPRMAPLGLITLWGSRFSTGTAVAPPGPVSGILGGACLTVNGIPAPLLFVSPVQVNAQLPPAAEGNATLVLRTPGGISDNLDITVLPSAPAVFHSGTAGPDTGIPLVVRMSNGELATLANPIHHGDMIVIYATGLGRTTPPLDAGLPAPLDPLLAALVPPQVALGGVPLPLLFAGLSPGQIGVYQIVATVPGRVPAGMMVPLTITQGASSTALPMRVVD